MSGDLSRSLVDAAVAPIADAYGEDDATLSVAEQAVAAVLETLAATLNESARHHDALGSIDHAELRGLAAEVKEADGG